MTWLDLIVRYRRGQTYGVHTLIAALEVEPPTTPYRLHLARSCDEVTTLTADAVRAGRRALVAWSFYSPDAPAMAEELRLVREGTPDGPGAVVHVAGGVHASAEPLVTLRDGYDLAAVGDGEATFTALVAAVADGGDGRGLPGTAHLDAAGGLVKGPRAIRHDLDHYPAFPHTRSLTSPIELTRGCVYACQFSRRLPVCGQ